MLELYDISKSFPGVEALCGVNCRLAPGAITVLLGPNGAGKSTLMRILSGILSPDKGSIHYMGALLKRDEFLPYTVGFLSDNNLLDQSLSVGSLLLLIARLKKIQQPWDEIRKWTHRFNIENTLHKRIGTLSSGYQQRVALTQAFLGNPKILLLDEPALSLDPSQYRQLEEILLEEKQNRIILLSTHRLRDMERIGDHLILLNDGKILKQDQKDRLLSSLENRSQIVELGCTNLSFSWFLMGASIPFQTDNHQLFRFPDWNEKTQSKILSYLGKTPIPLSYIREDRKSLEELFFELLQRKGMP